MPSDFPGSPRLLKGALVVFETSAPVPTNLIVFQYNPDSMSRAFQQVGAPPGSGPGGAGASVPLLPPIETFSVTVELDAADQIEANNTITKTFGLHPVLAALELLLYPSSAALILNKVLALAGSSVITPNRPPLVLLVWGPARVVPVRVTTLTIVEQAFDQLLNPIQARVALGMRCLTLPELDDIGPPFDTLALVRHIAKEVLARTNGITAAVDVVSSISF